MDSNTKIEWVKKRDGRIVPFQKEKIVNAIYKALKSTDKDDQLLAQEMTEAVTFYLSRNGNAEIPDIETIQDAVERVLVEMKLFTTAKAYILYRDKRARLRQTIEQAKTTSAVEPPAGPRGLRWDREKVIRSLLEELRIPRLLAERIADIVEENTLTPRRDRVTPDQLDLTMH